jgi:hypothetical protein
MKHKAAFNRFHERLDAATPKPPSNVPGQPCVTVEGRGEEDWRPQINRLKRLGIAGPMTKIVCLENLSLLKIYRISESVHPQQSNPPAATLDGPLVLCAARLKRAETDLTDGTAADGLRLLRPRDVRSDNAGRRPPEMRRSCQRKAVGYGGGPDNLCLATDAFCSCDNSENNKTGRDVSAFH